MKDNTTARETRSLAIYINLTILLAVLVAFDVVLRCATRTENSATAVPKGVVVAQEFRLVDEQGHLRGKLGVVKGKPGLALYGKDESGKDSGNPRAVLTVTSSGDPVLALMDKDGETPRAMLDLSDKREGAAALRFYDKDNKVTYSAP